MIAACLSNNYYVLKNYFSVSLSLNIIEREQRKKPNFYRLISNIDLHTHIFLLLNRKTDRVYTFFSLFLNI